MRTLILIGLTLFATLVSAEDDTLNYVYTPSLDADAQVALNRLIMHARNDEFDVAIRVSQDLLDSSETLQTSDPALYGQILINHGILHSAYGDYELGLSIIDRGMDYLAGQSNPFDRKLINAVMAKALTEMALGQLEQAEDSFRRAQHITHRQDGVYSDEQMTILNYITATSLRRGDPRNADRQQLLSLSVAEKTHGPMSVELLPLLNRLGSYFASRGATLPIMFSSELRVERDQLFKHSLGMYERAINIIESAYGENDLRLVPSLRGLASARMMQLTKRRMAEQALARAHAIVNANPASDLSDKAQALVDLGDLYIITSDPRASSTYLEAWTQLQENERAQQLADSLFGAPIRLAPRKIETIFLDRLPDAATPGDELYVELEYDVSDQGRVFDIRVLENNVPNEQVRLVRQRVKNVRYRPRIEAGTLVTTEDLVLRQQFQVVGIPRNETAPAPAADMTTPASEPANLEPSDNEPTGDYPNTEPVAVDQKTKSAGLNDLAFNN